MKELIYVQVALFGLFLGAANSAAAVVVGSNVVLGPSSDPFSDEYQMTVYQDEAGTDPTSLWFDFVPPELVYGGVNLDEGSDWYGASLGDEFTEANIIGGGSTFSTFGPMEDYTVPSLEFYLAVNTGQGAPGSDRDVYGWVLLRTTGTEIELVDSAMAYGFGGIVVGTTETIPEPSGTGLLALAAFFVVAARRRRRPVS